jgi:hypothetical protein
MRETIVNPSFEQISILSNVNIIFTNMETLLPLVLHLFKVGSTIYETNGYGGNILPEQADGESGSGSTVVEVATSSSQSTSNGNSPSKKGKKKRGGQAFEDDDHAHHDEQTMTATAVVYASASSTEEHDTIYRGNGDIGEAGCIPSLGSSVLASDLDPV